MAKQSTLADIDSLKAEEIIAAIRKGVPPEKGAELYSIGRDDLLSYFDQTFEALKNKGISDIKFISGDWGRGKSHFLDLLRDIALAHNFVVAKVELISGEVSFDQLPLVIQRIMDNLVTMQSTSNGIEGLLNVWSQNTLRGIESDLFFASTPSFLGGEHEHGAQSYPALWRRIRDQLPDLVSKSYKNVIIDLPELSEVQLASAAIKIKAIYQFSYGKSIRAVTESNLRTLANYVMTHQDRSIGTMVRSTIYILDNAIEEGFNFMSRFELIVERVVEQEAIDRAK